MDPARNNDYPRESVVLFGCSMHYWKKTKSEEGSAQVVNLEPGDEERSWGSYLFGLTTYDLHWFVAIGGQLLSRGRFDTCVQKEDIHSTTILFKSLGKIDD